ncbi:MAG: hypothetical protein NT051_03155 [Candidatus Micrarchaeota archaeon]|nr:hypothetical protein [Candidatus Micrarchaeota archaeon]
MSRKVKREAVMRLIDGVKKTGKAPNDAILAEFGINQKQAKKLLVNGMAKRILDGKSSAAEISECGCKNELEAVVKQYLLKTIVDTEKNRDAIRDLDDSNCEESPFCREQLHGLAELYNDSAQKLRVEKILCTDLMLELDIRKRGEILNPKYGIADVELLMKWNSIWAKEAAKTVVSMVVAKCVVGKEDTVDWKKVWLRWNLAPGEMGEAAIKGIEVGIRLHLLLPDERYGNDLGNAKCLIYGEYTFDDALTRIGEDYGLVKEVKKYRRTDWPLKCNDSYVKELPGALDDALRYAPDPSFSIFVAKACEKLGDGQRASNAARKAVFALLREERYDEAEKCAEEFRLALELAGIKTVRAVLGR